MTHSRFHPQRLLGALTVLALFLVIAWFVGNWVTTDATPWFGCLLVGSVITGAAIAAVFLVALALVGTVLGIVGGICRLYDWIMGKDNG